jgi:glutathione S-transferase
MHTLGGTAVTDLVLVSHHLCPYVQRAAIALAEKSVGFERRVVDLAAKPDWFLAISPTGKVPVLIAGGRPIFESAVILEYLEDTFGPALHPADPLARADHRAWIEFGSALLADIAGFYNAKDEAVFEAKRLEIARKLARVEERLIASPWFDGESFSLVDAVYAPVFRYFDLFDAVGDFGFAAGTPKIARWRSCLARRPSVKGAVSADYPASLRAFIAARGSLLSRQVSRKVAA